MSCSSHVELEIARVIDTPEATHIRYRVRRCHERAARPRPAVRFPSGWHQQQAPSSGRGGERHELSRPGQGRLDLPAGWIPPAKLEYDDIRARAISRADNDDDVQGINVSIELIRRTRAADGRPSRSASTSTTSMRSGTNASSVRRLVHLRRVRLRGQYLGCCYLYPMGRRAPLTEELLTYDVDVAGGSRPMHTSAATTRSCSPHCGTGSKRHSVHQAYYSNTEYPELPGEGAGGPLP